MKIALEYACARSKKTEEKIIIATFVEPIDVLTTHGVSEIMKNEARDDAEGRLKEAASLLKTKQVSFQHCHLERVKQYQS